MEFSTECNRRSNIIFKKVATADRNRHRNDEVRKGREIPPQTVTMPQKHLPVPRNFRNDIFKIMAM